jgi:hypothetical protein
MSDKKTKLPTALGLAGLYEVHQQNVFNGKRIFELVMQEMADANTLAGIVYQESLLQLIFHVLDHRTIITSGVNRDKSAMQRSAAASAERKRVFDWCDANPEYALLPYKTSVPRAMAATSISASTSVRDALSEWRKSRKSK